MPNTIKLKPFDQMGSSLEPGELVIDEAGRALYLDKGTGPEAIPLDREPLPKTPRPADPKTILIKGENGPEWALLQGAGGGPPLANSVGYVVPGSRPNRSTHDLVINNTNPASPYTAPVHINENVTVRRMLIRPNAGVDILFTFGIRDSDGNSLVEFTESAYAGFLEQTTFLELSPGFYETYVYVESALNFKAIGYRDHWSIDEFYKSHVIWMRFD